MDRTPVSSSNVSSVGYDPETKVMEIEFKDGSVYHYHDVESNTHAGLMAAKSHGQYVHAHIKGQYKHSRI